MTLSQVGDVEPAGRPVVLVIDDSEGFRRAVCGMLTAGDPQFAVHTVGTGEDAVAFLQGAPPFADAPDLAFVVLDFHLPDVSAPEFLEAMRELLDRRRIPVLVLSQADWAEDRVAAIAAGARHFRPKPSDLEELRELIVRFWQEGA